MRKIQAGTGREKVLVVGEAPGQEEDRSGKPFVGMAGYELDRLLGASSWQRSDFFLTNVCHERPPGNEVEAFFANKTTAKKEKLPELAGRYPRQPIWDGLRQLQEDIDRIQPQLIIAMGNTALWALTGHLGITKWRGSILEATGGPVDGHRTKAVATMHPAALLREPVWRSIIVEDLKKARRELAYPEVRRPPWRFFVPTKIQEAEDWLDEYIFQAASKVTTQDELTQPITADVENSTFNGSLHCLGIASSPLDAICIPFAHKGALGDAVDYWETPEDEVRVVDLCRRALRSRPVIFHNGLHDCQILSLNWALMPNFRHDTMVMQHVLYPGMMGGKIDPITGKVDKKGSSLSLAFISSLYCKDYVFWKDDGRDWDPAIHSEQQFWEYNCTDVVRTYENYEELRRRLMDDNLWEQYLFEMQLFEPVFSMMFRGLNYDDELRRQFAAEVDRDGAIVQDWIDRACGHPLNIGSSPQMQQLFYQDLQVPPILHRKTRQPTLDDKALDTIIKRRPAYRPLIERIQLGRSLRVFKSDYLDIKLSKDKRLRGAFGVAGTETMRFNSSTSALGEGFNLQTMPRDE